MPNSESYPTIFYLVIAPLLLFLFLGAVVFRSRLEKFHKNSLIRFYTGKKEKTKEKKHKNKTGKKVKEKKEEKEEKEEKPEHVQFEEPPQILPPEHPVQVC